MMEENARRPLSGKTIVITRAAGQAAEFARMLEKAGAEVVSIPTIRIAPPRSWSPVDRAIDGIRQYDWILFTSVNGVTTFFQRLKTRGARVQALKALRIGAIGPKTASRLQDLGLNVDAWPEEYRAEALAEVIGKVRGHRILLARAEKARDILPRTLEKRGAQVDVITVYRTLKPRRLVPPLKKRFLAGEIDVVTFTSSSTVDGFLRHFTRREARLLFKRTEAAAIGPITAATLRRAGIHPVIRADRYTIEGLTRALVRHFSK